ncbi:nuclear transport factor 2 family protein [Pseudooceanicola sp. CBS1P-1]|uniref:nuclear transport factor 2 family protein n=1 Tax=Pseudooceanicola TaxID=1679449 RepID=UPI001926433C|nr:MULTISPECIES: nuclear transport factor 2 family protein [Pseudooceanicola]MBT9386777.1 nuclear transport factor 2 family protein [Pseudooceanicola endophyticus]
MADIEMLNGAVRFHGLEGMRAHYMTRIWPHFEERLEGQRFLSSSAHVAIEKWTRFFALGSTETLFGPVRTDERYLYYGLIFYDLRDGRFSAITVSYNSFDRLNADGSRQAMGLPH